MQRPINSCGERIYFENTRNQPTKIDYDDEYDDNNDENSDNFDDYDDENYQKLDKYHGFLVKMYPF